MRHLKILDTLHYMPPYHYLSRFSARLSTVTSSSLSISVLGTIILYLVAFWSAPARDCRQRIANLPADNEQVRAEISLHVECGYRRAIYAAVERLICTCGLCHTLWPRLGLFEIISWGDIVIVSLRNLHPSRNALC